MKKIVVIIFGLAVILRMWGLTTVPGSMNWDELTFGYNAYSLLLTGKDEYGVLAPLEFKSVGDYKAPANIYFLVSAIALIGQNDLAIRLTSAIFGAIAVMSFFAMAYYVTSSKKVASIATLLLAISPWHLQFTRAGADVAVGTGLVSTGLALLVGKHNKLGAGFLAMATYAYFAERLFVPLVLIFLLTWLYVRKVYSGQKVLTTLMVFTLSLAPLLGSLVSSGHKNKIFITTILSYELPTVEKNIATEQLGQSALVDLIYHPSLEYFRLVLTRMANLVSADFLFNTGPEDGRQRIEDMGMMYRFEWVLIIAGLLALRKKGYLFVVLIFWLIIAALPAAITKDAVHARRAINMTYPLALVSAAGAVYLLKIVRGHKVLKVFLTGFFGMTVIYSVVFYGVFYSAITPVLTAKGTSGWQWGYKQLVETIAPIQDEYRQVVVDTSYQGSYIFFLWYEGYSPRKYQPQARLKYYQAGGLGEGEGYDKYVFRPVVWHEDRGERGVLFAAAADKIPVKDIDTERMTLIKTIYFPDGSEAWRIVAVN